MTIEYRGGRAYSTLLERYFLSEMEARNAEYKHALTVRNGERAAGRQFGDAEAQMFMASTPEYLMCTENGNAMEERFASKGITWPTRAQCQMVWDELVAEGKAILKRGTKQRLTEAELYEMPMEDLEQGTRQHYNLLGLQRMDKGE